MKIIIKSCKVFNSIGDIKNSGPWFVLKHSSYGGDATYKIKNQEFIDKNKITRGGSGLKSGLSIVSGPFDDKESANRKKASLSGK
jgi:hypothetical protein